MKAGVHVTILFIELLIYFHMQGCGETGSDAMKPTKARLKADRSVDVHNRAL